MKVRAFWALLEESDLLDPDTREQAIVELKRCRDLEDATPLAVRLTERNWLTAWQAEQLLAGFSTFRLGRYVLLEAIGQGGMGAVFKACHPAMGRVVAIKILSKARLDNPRAIARFQREMQAAARLDHPNIITAHDAGAIGNQYFLVMEYCEGQDLNAWQKHYGKLPIPWACEFIRQAAFGLQHAHERGMVHRDIKPANLLVIWNDPEGMPLVKILDLGLARSIVESGAAPEPEPDSDAREAHVPTMEGTVTQDGAIVGTPDYLSPEQIEGRAVDIRSDLFSLGCSFFKLLTGQIPFGGKTLVEKIHHRTSRSAPPAMALRTLRPDAPPELEALVRRLLERDPAKRPQTPQEVAVALAPFAMRAAAKSKKKAKAKADAAGAAPTGSGETPSSHGAAPAGPQTPNPTDQAFVAPPVVPEPPRLPDDWTTAPRVPQGPFPQSPHPAEEPSQEFLRLLARQGGQVRSLNFEEDAEAAESVMDAPVEPPPKPLWETNTPTQDIFPASLSPAAANLRPVAPPPSSVLRAQGNAGVMEPPPPAPPTPPRGLLHPPHAPRPSAGIPQAGIPQAGIPRAGLPVAGLPTAGPTSGILSQPPLPQAVPLPQVPAAPLPNASPSTVPAPQWEARFRFEDGQGTSSPTGRSRLRDAALRRRWWQRNGGLIAFLTAAAVIVGTVVVLAMVSQHRPRGPAGVLHPRSAGPVAAAHRTAS